MFFWKKKKQKESENTNIQQQMEIPGMTMEEDDGATVLLTEDMPEYEVPQGQTVLNAGANGTMLQEVGLQESGSQESVSYEEDDDDYEGSTTLLTEEMTQYAVPQEVVLQESVVTSQESVSYEEEDDDYEGSTTLLTEEMTQYAVPQEATAQAVGAQTEVSQGQWLQEPAPQESIFVEEEEEDDEGATTLLSMSPYGKGASAPQGMSIPAKAPKAQLVRIIKPEKIDITKIKFVVGSAADADYIVPNGAVSRRHAFIIFKDDKYFLVDNRSTNRTYIDGEVIEPSNPRELYHGALIQFSDELYQFMLKS